MNNISRYIPADDQRLLSEDEIKVLISKGNHAQTWSSVTVSHSFDPNYVTNCKLVGYVYFGAPGELVTLHDGLVVPAGISDCTIANCVILNGSVLQRVGFIANYLIENNVVILNTSEITSNSNASFGNGYRADHDTQVSTIAVVNENGGRSIVPFQNMNSSDVYLFLKYSHNSLFKNKLAEITKKTIHESGNTAAKIGAFSRIFNTRCIRNTIIESHALIDGADLIDNSTILSDHSEPSTIKAGVQISNAIIGFGNDLRSSCQLQSVVTGTAVSISQTARISHSCIGDNSAISCCEIAHAFLFPSHGQHHNNSFLIASLIGGQSNIAAGATIGSNHNSRVNDGELWANRGFWPGLCTSFKHNSKFASYVMCAKADYPSELSIPYPFTLVSNDLSTNSLVLYPAWWISNNMYALMRSRFKFVSRDKRVHKGQNIEHSPLAPDTIIEAFKSLKMLELQTGRHWYVTKNTPNESERDLISKGNDLLRNENYNQSIEIPPYTIEKSSRKVIVKKPAQAWRMYRNIIKWYCAKVISDNDVDLISEALKKVQCDNSQSEWVNVGGQIVQKDDIDRLVENIASGKSITCWNDIHQHFNAYFKQYPFDLLVFALNSLFQLYSIEKFRITPAILSTILRECKSVFHEFSELTKNSRKKDYNDPFRSMVYDSVEEEITVLGKLESDSVVQKSAQEAVESVEKLEILIEKIDTIAHKAL